jgi:hypothetical protein
MRHIKIYGVYFLNVVTILRGGEEGHTLFRILPALVHSASVSLVRHTDHLTSPYRTSGQTYKFLRTAIKYDMKQKNNTTKRLTEERGQLS